MVDATKQSRVNIKSTSNRNLLMSKLCIFGQWKIDKHLYFFLVTQIAQKMAMTKIPETIPTVIIWCRNSALPSPISFVAVNEIWRARNLKLYWPNARQMLPQCTVALTRVDVKFNSVAPVTPTAPIQVEWDGSDLDLIHSSFGEVLRCDDQGLFPCHVPCLQVNAQCEWTG